MNFQNNSKTTEKIELMCYDIKTTLNTQLKRAGQKGDKNAIEEIMDKLVPLTDLPLYHSLGFSHPSILIYTDRSHDFPEVSTWGLVPHWVKDENQMKKTWNNTLNARGETIFEKNSFRSSAKNGRCLIYVDGYYEHHHFKNETYPFYIFKKNHEPIIPGGLYNVWENPETGGQHNTFSIVTTSGNVMMAKIHNNPKLKGPRMPLILHSEMADKWLVKYEDELDQKKIEDLIREYPDEELTAHTVRTLRGKKAVGNVENASEIFEYAELDDVI